MWQAKRGVLVVPLALGGCSTVQLHATQREAVARELVRVEVGEIRGNILSFDVYNLSRLQLVVLRDKIVLETPTGRRGREPGDGTPVPIAPISIVCG